MNHFLGTSDELCKHHNHPKNLKGMPMQQTHGTSQYIVSEYEFGLRDDLCIHYHSRGFQV